MELEFLDDLDIDLEFPRGDQFPVSFKVKDKVGDYLEENDINDIVVTCRKYPSEESEVLFQKKLGEDIEYVEDNWTFFILNEDTKDLECGIYGYEIKLFVGDIIKTFTGHIDIKDEYTGELE